MHNDVAVQSDGKIVVANTLLRQETSISANNGDLIHRSITLLYAKARELAREQLRRLEHPQRAEVTGESIETVKQAISGLPPLERETLILFEYEGLPVNEIATIVEAEGEMVEARLETARQRLRSVLSRYFS